MEIYRDELYEKAILEHFDIDHEETRKILLSVNEADQNQILLSLTSKLYENIIEKVDDIDYGDIPETKGDFSKLPNFEKLIGCHDTIKKILVQYKQDTTPIDTIILATQNIVSRKVLFEKAFRFKVELPMVLYNSICLAIISSTSLIISTSIEFIKQPSEDNFAIILNKVSLSKTRENLLFTNLEKFNNTCKSGNFDSAMDHVINTNIKQHNLLGAAMITHLTATVAIIGILYTIVPIIRELVFFYYHSRTRVSDYFDAQADLLQMNAANLEVSETKSLDERKKISARQYKIVDIFKKIANKISINNKEAEVKATKDIAQNKKFKADEVMDKAPDSAAASLF